MKVANQVKKRNKLIRMTAEEDLYSILKEMGYSQKKADQIQRKRILQTIAIAIAFLLFGLIFSRWFYIGAIILPFVVYKIKYKKIKSQYTTWKFQRHLQFSKFTRLLIPYLKQSKGQSLYSIFNRILQRMDNKEDKKLLYTLMTEMSTRPNDIQPFIDYANKTSGTDMAVLFMSTIFDFKQSTFDISVIDELGKIASEELMNGIDEIIEYKLKRFVFFPTKLVMSCFIIVLGFATSVLVANLANIQF